MSSNNNDDATYNQGFSDLAAAMAVFDANEADPSVRAYLAGKKMVRTHFIQFAGRLRVCV